MIINFPKIYSYFKKPITERVVRNASASKCFNNSNLSPLPNDVIEIQKAVKKPIGTIVEAESGTLKLVAEGEDLGVVILCKKDYQQTRKGYPDYYNDLSGTLTKPFLEINILRSFEQGMGVGTKLVQEAVKRSLELGFEGRLLLVACSTDGKTSPLAFYYKMGFRSIDSKTNKLIERYIRKNKIIPRDESSFMYLPKENIPSLLAK